MAGIEDKLRNVRTLEDIVNILAILFNNMNTLSRNYYDLFVNPTAMTVPMKLYDDNGKLVTKEIPNVASYRSTVKVGNGSPEGKEPGGVGAFYIDLDAPRNLYYKAADSNGTGETTDGWKLLYDSGMEFLAPTGNGSELTDLSASQISSGVLSVPRGGTGSSGTFSGVVKANGTAPYSKAEEGIDFIGPTNMVGVVSYFAGVKDINGNDIDFSSGDIIEINGGWLVCNGATLDVTDPKYTNLVTVLGSNKLPDLMDIYIKGSTSVATATTEATVGKHSHGLDSNYKSGTVLYTTTTGSHSHNKGSMRITGQGIFSSTRITSLVEQGTISDPNQYYTNFYQGAIGIQKSGGVIDFSSPDVNDNAQGKNGGRVIFDTSLNNGTCWTGTTNSAGSHSHSLGGLRVLDYENPNSTINDVRHKTMIPIIKY